MLETLADMSVVDGVVLVTGSPAAGKTTLARGLADCIAAKHVSVGEQLRLLPLRDTLTPAYGQAYAGHRPFPHSALCRALARGIGDRHFGPLVVDGSIGLREAVLDVVGHLPVAEFQLELDEVASMKRLAQRAASGERADDVAAIAYRRAITWRRICQETSPPPWPVIPLDANLAAQELLGNALHSLLVLTGADVDKPLQQARPTGAGKVGRHLAYGADRARTTGQPHVVLLEADELSGSGLSVVVMKPGLGQAARTFDRFLEWLHNAGCHAKAASVWPLTSPGIVRRVVAHHGLHYVNSRWGAQTVARIVGEARPIVGYLQTKQHWHEAEWLCDVKMRSRVKRGSNLWIDVEGDQAVVNSHAPGVIAGWFSEPNDVIIALIVGSKGAALYEHRFEALGDPDPQRAPVRSLRCAAYTGEIPFKHPPTLQNNGFHISDSRAAFELEKRLWFELG